MSSKLAVKPRFFHSHESYVEDGIFRSYLAEVEMRPLLSAQEEREATCRELVEANVRLVIALARATSWSSLPLEDRIGYGNIGLIRAAQKYDPSRGRFTTYATWWIRQAIWRASIELNSLIHIPSYVGIQINQMYKATERLTAELGRKPRKEEIAEALGVSLEKLAELVRVQLPTLSLDIPYDGSANDNYEFEGMTLGTGVIDEEDGYAPVNNSAGLGAAIEEALGGLSKRERRIIRLLYGLDGAESSTASTAHTRSLEEVACILGITRERVRQIEQVALGKLRKQPMALVQWREEVGA